MTPRPGAAPGSAMGALGVLVSVALVFWTSCATAAAPSHSLDEFKASIHNKASLQRGAKYFVNYCLSCHSAQYSRYRRVGEDLGLTDEMVRDNMMFTEQKIGDLMKVSMTPKESTAWFGSPAPDLTLVTRSRSPAWVYTYLRSFYLDESRPMGVNNRLFQNVAMPHVLWRLQGWQTPIYGKDKNGGKVVTGLKLSEPGVLSEEEYDGVVRDIVNFMAYLGEPAALKRKNVGVGVILFLLVLLAAAYLLKREYWKDVK